MVESGKIIPFSSGTGLRFGVFAGNGSDSSGELTSGKPDSPDDINRALDALQGEKQLLVRIYLRFTGDSESASKTPLPDLARYTWRGRKLDLVLSNWDPQRSLSSWAAFVEDVIDRYHPYLGCLQICEEPNLYDYPGDGRFDHSAEAIITGVKVARESIKRVSAPAVVGFNSVPSLNSNDRFWKDLSRRMDDAFLGSLDYVGINFYPDISVPVSTELSHEVTTVLTRFREENLVRAGIPLAVPIHVSENGWPTGPYRFYTRQSEVIEQTIRTIYRLRARLNITHYELFALRDADTANPSPDHQFGILRDDYSPKPAFETYKDLIAELGV